MPATNPFVPDTIPQAGNLDYISSLDAYAPLFAQQLYQPYGGQGIELLTMLKAMGAAVAVNRSTGDHWEEDRFMSSFRVKAIVAPPGAGANLVFNLDAADIDPVTRQSFPIINEVIQHVPTGRQFTIINKVDNGTDTTITARPLKATTDIGLSAGDYFFITTNSVGERSTQQDTQYSFQTKYTWLLQHLRKDYSISGTAFTEQLQFVKSEDGKTILGVNSLASAQAEYRHLLATVGAMIWGESATNTGLPGFQYTSGMIEQFKARAVNMDTGGTLAVADFASVSEQLSANFAFQNYLTLVSEKSYSEISNDIISDFDQSNINAVNNQISNVLFGASGYDVNALQATYSVKGLTVNGRNFGIKRLTILDDPSQAAAGSMANKQRDYGFVLPIGKTVDADGVPRGFVELKYKSNYGKNRMLNIWSTGGASPQRNTPVDDHNLHILSELGFDFMNLQQCALFKNGSLS